MICEYVSVLIDKLAAMQDNVIDEREIQQLMSMDRYWSREDEDWCDPRPRIMTQTIYPN